MVLQLDDVNKLAMELDQALIYAGQNLDEPPPEASRSPRYVMPLRAFATSVATVLAGEAITGLRIELARHPWARTYRVVATTPAALVEGEVTIGDSADGSDSEAPSVTRRRLADVLTVVVAHDALCIRERQGTLVPGASSVILGFEGNFEMTLEDTSDPMQKPRELSGIDLLTVPSLVASVAASSAPGRSL